ncbi:MAG: hypothetical protein V4479_00225 [Actinomycetota bacterium]
MAKKRKVDLGKYVDPPVTPIPAVERIIEEGVLIATSAVRMTIKNQIIVAALRDHADFDESTLADAARADFVRLAEESEYTAARLEKSGKPKAPIVYESKVDANRRKEHRRRPKVERQLALALRAESDDNAAISALVARAKLDASEELRREVVNRLVSVTVEPDPDYEEFKAGRIAYLLTVDLAGLRKDRAKKGKD